MKKIAIIASTDRGIQIGITMAKEFQKPVLVSTRPGEGNPLVQHISSIADFLQHNYKSFDAFVFIGALGICVRSIAPYLQDKKTDPAVVNADDAGRFVQSVVSGHEGGANELAAKLAHATGATAVITTSSDNQDIWSLDMLSSKYGWALATDRDMNELISLFVNNKPVALLLDVKDEGTAFLEKTCPSFVHIFYNVSEIDFSAYELFIAVTYKKYTAEIPTLYFHPKALHLGMGCNRGIEYGAFKETLKREFDLHELALESLKSFASIDLKQDEEAFLELAKELSIPFITYKAEELNTMQAINPSAVVEEKLGVESVSEASAMLLSSNSRLLVEKQKLSVPSGKHFTLAVALERSAERKAEIAIVGAGPGDAELVSVKGKYLLERADLILYAGSLIPEELTMYAKQGAVVRNSAGMTLEEQIQVMEEHYAKGHLIVRLQSGDPSIYGAIQEQMTIFDERGMNYYIVPGISSFQAAAASLKSEFTIPEVVQSIILTRGEGETPMPSSEKLNEMAKHKATMCIFLSAQIAKKVQEQLLEHYEAETPVAVLYRVSWKDEKIITGTLTELADIIRSNKLTRTVLIIVGTAIGARKNRSNLYNPDWKHIFRTGKVFTVKES